MKNKVALSLALVLAFVASAGAVQSRRTPNANDGQPIRDALYGGSDVKIQSSTAAQMICTGKCLLLGITRGTGPLATSLILRDTGTADGDWRRNILPMFSFHLNESAYLPNPIGFPVVFSVGISADLDGSGEVAIHFLDVDE